MELDYRWAALRAGFLLAIRREAREVLFLTLFRTVLFPGF